MSAPTSRRSRQYLRWFGFTALAWLSSCSILPSETIAIYQLPPSSIVPATAPDRLPLTLHIAKGDSSRVTDSQRVLILNQDNRISAYKSVRWSDPPPVLLRNQLASAFRADGRLSLVSDSNPNLTRDLELSGDLDAFHVEHSAGTTVAVVRFYAVLAQPARNRILAARGFESRQPVNGKGMPDVVAAFGKGADEIGREIIGWTIQHGNSMQAGGNEMPASAGRTNPPEEKP
ncbi:ABC-type transport auxiliary lipoprotein family protein [Nitrosospira sp. Is2]|uniref:ABC-type transport auxiliary lipoprotein family protein n=1 Tax=Nitrosospira sp. Is2 TaxID=3080532 RepID=UPI00295488F7|nr:ABC-type transport auxiliary lipoprotein family protein [Nitrosospira sp. Is2]WON73889.1 ABC-type transport auxiliary lipoprotein family protein [Nitrosospira sp. Is2]